METRFRYYLLSLLPQSTVAADGSKIVPLLALQVTLFPEKGICIGYAFQHVAGDGSSMHAFINSWASICSLGEDSKVIPPNYDRLLVKNHTKELDDVFWKQLKIIKSNTEHAMAEAKQAQLISPETDEKVRATFVIALEDIQKHLSDAGRSIKHLSTFTVVCDYVWTCLVKRGNAIADKVDEDELEQFICSADCRGRTDPIIPANYFGNCLTHCMTSAKNRQLSGEEGFLNATELIGEAIYERLHYQGGVLRGLETFFADMSEVKNMAKVVSVAGSPRQNYYDMDFGFGKPRKVEVTSIDSTGAISITASRDASRVPEIGLALPKKRMDAFIKLFRKGL
ncbi:hypothetical protein LIER_28290 [Lithospermum erythrorhizon]|uniref:Uncharacterized protein n=1 Tax=Lithospermum erythrorhizon TaxID=34254 RepID=A0AAV3RL68_LITER